MSRPTKHRQIVEHILNQLLEGKYKPGERLPSDNQLTREFGASRPTVSKAMRQLEDEGHIERRAGSGSFVRITAQSKPSLIGLLTPEIGQAELFEPLCSEIAKQCQKNGLSLLWSDSSIHDEHSADHEQIARELCQRYISQQVSGVFFAPVEFSDRMIRVNREIAERLDEAGISVILLDRDLERLPKRSRFDWVGIDNFRAGFMQAQYLIEVGCKNLAYVSRTTSAPTIDLRIAGFQHALRQSPLDTSEESIFCGDVTDSNFLKTLLPKTRDGIVCSNDTTALLLMSTLQDAGYLVPDDLRIIGIDDVKLAAQSNVPLTTVRQPFRAMGKAAVETMISRIENRTMEPRDIFVNIEIVTRQSCGANIHNESD